jgi:hypothetical protein
MFKRKFLSSMSIIVKIKLTEEFDIYDLCDAVERLFPAILITRMQLYEQYRFVMLRLEEGEPARFYIYGLYSDQYIKIKPEKHGYFRIYRKVHCV